MAATYPADTFQEGVDLTIEASNQLAQVVRGDANTEVTVADGSTIPSIRKAQTDSMYFKEPEPWTTGQTETDYLQLKKYTDPTTGKESWWFAKGALVSNPIAMGTSPFGDDNWTLYTPEDLFISGKAEYESIYQALKGKAAEAGYNLVRGSFEEGGTLTNTNDVLWYQSNGRYYSWKGSLPKVVPAGATPATSGGIGAGAWVDRTDVIGSLWFNTVQDMKDGAGLLAVGMTAITRGYYSAGDGGGAEYLVEAGNTGDGHISHNIGANTASIQVSDGVRISQTGITMLSNSILQSIKHYPHLIFDNNVTITEPLSAFSNMKWEGNGINHIQLPAVGAQEGVITHTATSTADFVKDVEFTNIRFFGGSSTETNYVARLHGVGRFRMTRCRLWGCGGLRSHTYLPVNDYSGSATPNQDAGVDFSNLNYDFFIKENYCEYTGRNGDHFWLGYVKNSVCDDNTSIRASIGYWGGDSRPDAGGRIQNYRAASYMRFSGNYGNNGNACIWGSNGQKINIVNNTSVNCADVAFDIEGTFNSTIIGNSASNSVNGNYSLFYFSDNSVFSGNSGHQSAGGVGPRRQFYYSNGHENFMNPLGSLIEGNTFYSEGGVSREFFIQRGAVRVLNNIMYNTHYRQANDAGGVHGTYIEGNHMLFEGIATTITAIEARENTDAFDMEHAVSIKNNTILTRNCTGSYNKGIRIIHQNTVVNAGYDISNNSFGDGISVPILIQNRSTAGENSTCSLLANNNTYTSYRMCYLDDSENPRFNFNYYLTGNVQRFNAEAATINNIAVNNQSGADLALSPLPVSLNANSPLGTVVPKYQGELFVQTGTGNAWIAVGNTSSGWKQIT